MNTFTLESKDCLLCNNKYADWVTLATHICSRSDHEYYHDWAKEVIVLDNQIKYRYLLLRDKYRHT